MESNYFEETHPILAPAVKEVWTGQEKSRIAFLYNESTYFRFDHDLC
jgi:hypothetical protein